MNKIFLVLSIVIALFINGCSTPSPHTPQSKKPPKKKKIINSTLPTGYKLLKLDTLRISIAVPKGWKIHKELLYGQSHYFIGILNDTSDSRIDSAEIWDTFLTNPFNIHGVHIQSIDGSPQSIETELNTNTLPYPVISDKNLSNKRYVIRSVLKKSAHNGYYQFYAIGSKKNPQRGLMLELVSKLYSNKNDTITFKDRADKKEIQTIINSIKAYQNF